MVRLGAQFKYQVNLQQPKPLDRLKAGASREGSVNDVGTVLQYGQEGTRARKTL